MKEKIKVYYSRFFTTRSTEVFKNCDLVIFGRKAFPELNYRKELKGGGDIISKMKSFSLKTSAPCLFTLKTDDYGRIKRSVFVYEKGKLSAISDANLPKIGESSSLGYKVVKTSIGKIGVCVSDDLKNPDCIKALSLCESQIIVNLYADIYDFNMQSLVPSLAYVYGVPIISCGAHGVISASAKGKTEYCENLEDDDFFCSIKREVKEVSVKTYRN